MCLRAVNSVHDILAWQRRPGMPWGTGVGRKDSHGSENFERWRPGDDGQRRFECWRADRTRQWVTPADGDYSVSGRKLWRADPDVEDVRKAFHAFVPPSVQAQLMAIVQWAMKVAEDATGMPAMLQGIRGDAPDTLGGMQMQQNNSSSTLRRIAKDG